MRNLTTFVFEKFATVLKGGRKFSIFERRYFVTVHGFGHGYLRPRFYTVFTRFFCGHGFTRFLHGFFVTTVLHGFYTVFLWPRFYTVFYEMCDWALPVLGRAKRLTSGADHLFRPPLTPPNLGGELVSLANPIAAKLYSSPPKLGGVRGGLNRWPALDASRLARPRT